MKILSWLIIAIFILVFLQFLISNIKILSKPVGGDFAYFYHTGQRVLTGQNPYIKEGESFLRNPPPALFIYSLLPIFPIHISQIFFLVISFIAFLIGSYFLLKIIDKSQNLTIWLIYLILALIFFPFRYAISSGHINNLLLLFLILTFYLLKEARQILAGLFLALAISLSVTPVFFAAILILQKKYRAFLWTILSLIIISAATLLRFGSDVFRNYQLASSSYLDFGISAYYNQSLAGLFTRTFNNPALTQNIISIVLIISLLIFFYLILKTQDKISQNIIIWNIVIIYILIFAPFAWQYHFVIIIFPLLTTFYLGFKLKMNYKFFLLLLLSYFMLGWNIKNPQPLAQINVLGPIILSHVLIGAIILLLQNFYQLKKLLR